MPTLKLCSNGHSNTVIGTLAVDGWAVTFGTARRGLGGMWPHPDFSRCIKYNSHPSTASVPTSYHLMWHYMPLGSKGLNERPVMDGQCTVMPRVSRGTTGSATDSSGGERGKLGEGGEAVSLLLPNVRQLLASTLLSPCARLPSPYSASITLRLCPKVHPCNILVLTQNLFPYAMYVIPFNVVGLQLASLTPVSASFSRLPYSCG